MVCHNCESPTTPGYALCATCAERLQKAISYCVDSWNPLQDIAAKKATAVPVGVGPRAASSLHPKMQTVSSSAASARRAEVLW